MNYTMTDNFADDDPNTEALDAEQLYENERLREVLVDELDAAIAATARATTAVRTLTSPPASDPDFFETGGDISAFCVDAHRHLAAARAHTRLIV